MSGTCGTRPDARLLNLWRCISYSRPSFVNALVDAHQTGMYAQSIAHIAARIGLPLWFVELRHAATHEELPSLSVLREAAAAVSGAASE